MDNFSSKGVELKVGSKGVEPTKKCLGINGYSRFHWTKKAYLLPPYGGRRRKLGCGTGCGTERESVDNFFWERGMERIGKTPALALGEWVANRDVSQCTHEVRTCYGWDDAYTLERDGWQIERAAWQIRKWLYQDDKGGWVISLARTKT